MVSRTRLRTALTTLGLYIMAAALIGYFGMNAFTGNRGIKATQDLAIQQSELSAELSQLRGERTAWQRRVALLRSESLDPDMLDEQARAMLDYVHPRDLVLLGPRPATKPAAMASAH
jgi:cell division protein FtsB